MSLDLVDEDVVVDEKVTESDSQEPSDDDTAPKENPDEETNKDEDKQEKADDQKPKPENRVQKRIDKLTREKYELKGRVEALEGFLQDRQTQSPDIQSDKPVRSQFESDEDWIEALTDYKAKAVRDEILKDRSDSGNVSFEKQENESRKQHEDYDDVVEDVRSIKVNTHVNDAITSSPLATEILYELGHDMDKAKAIARMSIPSAIREIGKIEAKLELKSMGTDKKKSNAPEPIRPPVARGAVIRDHIKDADKMPIEEWMKRERERELKKTKLKG